MCKFSVSYVPRLRTDLSDAKTFVSITFLKSGGSGNAVLASGATFCIAVWAYTATQIGIEWNLSPVGRLTPKEWRDQ
ncbi:unnamed protein product [Nyctereutes procyonoides]|uniref:Cytochrome c oxidase subunit 7B, mitochondrial n=1 Tax=Nyctereutes procyonoides TaxID=34880 RepID=A0A811ZQJ3_NYCPR|nr:unnamed protein product [Nyctereutes procyonoides]